MRWTSILAIYTLFWVMTAFFVLPFHARHVRGIGHGDRPHVAGQDHGAPPVFLPLWIAKWTSIVSAAAFATYYAIYVNGLIDIDRISALVGPST